MNRFRSPLLSGLLAVLLLPAMAPSSTSAAPSRVLLVVSSEGRDQGKTRPGFEMDEFAQAWLILKQNGFDIDVATEKRYAQTGCARLNVRFWQDGVLLPGTSVPRRQTMDFGINYCLDGQPPQSLK